jgi:hypothetical protein
VLIPRRASKLLEIAKATEVVDAGRIHIEKINGRRFCSRRTLPPAGSTTPSLGARCGPPAPVNPKAQ